MSNSLSAKSMRGCLAPGGLAVSGIGAAIPVTMLLGAPEAGITSAPGTAGGLVCMVVTIAAGLTMSWYGYRDRDDEEREGDEGSDDVESEILDVARDHDGRVTTEAVADGSSLTVVEAETMLTRLAEESCGQSSLRVGRCIPREIRRDWNSTMGGDGRHDEQR